MSPPPDYTAAIGGHPVVAEILWQRGYHDVAAARAFLDPDLYTPASPFALPDLDTAVARLRQAIAHSERIRIWGDFDVDGQTATSVLYLGLQACGALVDYTIPNRSTHSHGLNFEGIRAAKDTGVAILLTCDCGVTDFEYIDYARALGLDVIISDHHDLVHDEIGGVRLPNANATLNPKRLPETHTLAHLPGVGVAYELIVALMPSATALLDLVALGIVADLAHQQGDTRYLLQRGLQQLRSAARPGIRALMRAAAIAPQHFEAESIGYQIGPRLNAAGRLETAELSVQLLTAADDATAQPLAERIEQLNGERKLLQREIEAQAFAQLSENKKLLDSEVIVLHHPDWPASVIGVVANAIIDRYKKPAILIAARPGEVGRASGRSVAGIDIHAAIAAQTHLIEGGGGHPMAAGFAILAENVDEFRMAVSAHVRAQMAEGERPTTDPSQIAAGAFEVAWRDVSLGLCEQLDRLAPFGAGNPKPLLVSHQLTFVRAEPLGQEGRHQMLFLQDQQGYLARAAWWRSVGRPMPAPNSPVSLVFNVRRQVYQNRPRLQIEVVNLIGTALAQESDTAAEDHRVGERYRIIDLRKKSNAERNDDLERILAEFGHAQVQVWSEGAGTGQPSAIALRTRLELQPMPVLVIWSAPPSTDAVAHALTTAQPQTVVLLCGSQHASDAPNIFKPQMLRMLGKSREVGDALDDAQIIARMAARIGHRAKTVQVALAEFQANPDANQMVFSTQLTHLLEETRAYRRYFAEAPADAVLRVNSAP